LHSLDCKADNISNDQGIARRGNEIDALSNGPQEGYDYGGKRKIHTLLAKKSD
jgi:hypothetical protein